MHPFLACAMLLVVVVGCAVAAHAAGPAGESLVYVGTYTGPKSKGIYHFRLHPQDLKLVPLGLAAETSNPSFLAIDPKRRLLFAVNEVKDGTVSAFAIGAEGKLTLLNKQSSRGAGPCHVVLDKTGRYVIVSNYSSGSVAVLPVAADGKLGEASDVEQHAGKSIDPTRQEGPHAHGVTLDPANAFAFACDLGLDKVMVYRFDAAKGQLTPHDPPFVTVKPGAGPRHMAFRPDGKFAYVINELNSTITALAYDGNGGLKEVESVTTLPRDYEGPNFTAEIAVHPSGEFLYASNRGHESVVLYTIDAGTGKLTWVEGQSAGGKTPRHFGIEPGAKHMAIANQESDTVLAARIDGESGRLKPSGVFASCPSPTCAVFFVPPGGERQEAKE